MIWTSDNPSIYNAQDFEIYSPPGYITSKMHDVDEVYRISEVIFLHRNSGLRIAYTTTEDYTGDLVTYVASEVFAISGQERIKIVDINLKKQEFITSDRVLPFHAVSKSR
jgi:hypothetical protein